MRVASTVLFMLLFLGIGWAQPRELHVVVWSDIHYMSPQWAPAAWAEAFQRGRAVKPDVIVLGGDQMDNKCSQEEFLTRQEALLRDLRKKFETLHAPIVFTYGNNDVSKNYQTDTDLLRATTDMYARELGPYDYLDNLGNGVYGKAVGGMRWITLDSLFFSPYNQFVGAPEQARLTLQWLGRQLTRYNADAVVIVTHIPPTWDLYSGTLSWRREYLAQFTELIRHHVGPVVILGAHYHRNEIHGLPVPSLDAKPAENDSRVVPVILAGSISFKYGNYPNWRTMTWHIGAGGRVDRFDWDLMYPAHAEWNRHWRLDRPGAVETWRRFAQTLEKHLAAYLAYWIDLDAHNREWRAWADDPKRRNWLLTQILPSSAPSRAP